MRLRLIVPFHLFRCFRRIASSVTTWLNLDHASGLRLPATFLDALANSVARGARVPSFVHSTRGFIFNRTMHLSAALSLQRLHAFGSQMAQPPKPTHQKRAMDPRGGSHHPGCTHQVWQPVVVHCQTPTWTVSATCREYLGTHLPLGSQFPASSRSSLPRIAARRFSSHTTTPMLIIKKPCHSPHIHAS